MENQVGSVASRFEEIRESGLGKWLQEETFNEMNVLEGDASLSLGNREIVVFPARILLGRYDLPLPLEVSHQMRILFESNASLFQELFMEGYSRLTGGSSRYDCVCLEESNREILEDLRCATKQIPITLFYVHGSVTFDGGLPAMWILPASRHPKWMTDSLKEYGSYFPKDSAKKPLVMISACNSDGKGVSESFEELNSDQFKLLYREGRCGILSSSGEVVYRK